MVPSASRQVQASAAIDSLFGGAAQASWLLLGLGILLFWGFGAGADLSFLTFRGPVSETPGEVISVEEAGGREGRSRIHRYGYRYSVAGESMTGWAYRNGPRLSPGEGVTVQYLEGKPAKSRIENMRRAMWPPYALWTAVFPIVGLVLVARSTRRGWKNVSRNRDELAANAQAAGAVAWRLLLLPVLVTAELLLMVVL